MQRKGTQGDRDRRETAERGATQPQAGQPRAESDDEELQEPENAPSLLTARELQSRDLGRPEDDKAGQPEDRSERTPKKEPGKPKPE